MTLYENVRSNAEVVEELEITEETVIVRSGIQSVDEPGTEDQPGFSGWLIAKEEVFEKDEYIKLMSQTNTNLEATVDSILTDVIPSLMGM